MGEPGDRGADGGGFDDVVAAAFRHRALALAHAHLHVGDHHALAAEPLDVALKLLPRIVPGVVDVLGIPGDLGVPRAPAGLTDGQPVVVPGSDRDAQREPGGYPALQDQLGEVLPGKIGGERPLPARAAMRPGRHRPDPGGADGGADRLELQAAGRERADGQPDADHAVPAQFLALGRHPVQGLVPRLVHGLDQGRERAPAGARGDLRRGPGRHDLAVAPGPPGAWAAVAAGIADVVDAGAQYLAGRLEPDAADRGELVGGQRRAPGSAGPDFRHPGFGRGRQFIAHGPSLIEPASALTLQVFRVPFGVPLLYRFQRAGRRFPGRKRPEPVLAWGGTVVVLDGVRPEAVPPSLSLFTVHAH